MSKAAFSDKVMPFGDHLEELRSRLALALMGLAPILLVSLYFGKPILGFLMEPVYAALTNGHQAPNLQATNPFEVFAAYIKVSFVLSILVGAPWIVYQAWKFIAPGLYVHERRFAHLLAPLSAILTIASALFLYYVMLPTVLTFFVTFNSSMPGAAVLAAPLPQGVVLQTATVLDADPIDPPVGAIWYNRTINQLRICVTDDAGAKMINSTVMSGGSLISQQYKIADCVGLVLTFALALAIAFQMPVVVLLLGWAGLVTPAWLAGYRRHLLMICGALGAVLTPGADPVSMMLLAVPLYLLFELGLLLLRLLPASRVAGDRIKKSEHDTGDSDPFAKPDDQ